jgi:hypothetical protein
VQGGRSNRGLWAGAQDRAAADDVVIHASSIVPAGATCLAQPRKVQ